MPARPHSPPHHGIQFLQILSGWRPGSHVQGARKLWSVGKALQVEGQCQGRSWARRPHCRPCQEAAQSSDGRQRLSLGQGGHGSPVSLARSLHVAPTATTDMGPCAYDERTVALDRSLRMTSFTAGERGQWSGHCSGPTGGLALALPAPPLRP